MNHRPTSDHPDELLPWYANGTLAGEERTQVEEHLAQCPRCREELAFLGRLREQIQAQAVPAPGELGLKRLMRQVDAGQTPRRRIAWWQPSLAAAAVVIVVQGVLLLNLWQGDAGVRLAGTPAVNAVADGRVVQIRFAPDAREARIRELLQNVGGRIIDGPSAIGLYRVALQGDERAVARAMARLREHKEIVRHVAAE